MKIAELSTPNFQQLVESHLDHELPLEDNMFRMLSEAWCQLFLTARHMLAEGAHFHPDDQELLGSDIGTWGTYKGMQVPLDVPLTEHMHQELMEAEYHGKKVQLGKVKRGGSKKFYVYVRNPKTGKIKKISFGDATGRLKVKLADPKAKANFAARHRCEQANDRLTARYWACRLPRFSKSLGLSGGGRWW